MRRAATLREALDVLLQGRTGVEAFFHLWGLLGRLGVAAVILMAVIAVLLALEPSA